jgi:PLP dependent protein
MTVSLNPPQADEPLARLVAVRRRIAVAAERVGRCAESVHLLAVSKLQSTVSIRALYAAGQRAFGENYVQETESKVNQLSDLPGVEWHLIGPLQSNKTRVVAESVHWVHSVDRLKIAERLSMQRQAGRPPLNICIQVNISRETSKSGCLPDETVDLAVAASQLPNVRVRGLMGMPEPYIGPDATRQQFSLLAQLYAEVRAKVAGIDTLSMGMSDDLEIAVECGSTMVRVGTALFGARNIV